MRLYIIILFFSLFYNLQSYCFAESYDHSKDEISLENSEYLELIKQRASKTNADDSKNALDSDIVKQVEMETRNAEYYYKQQNDLNDLQEITDKRSDITQERVKKYKQSLKKKEESLKKKQKEEKTDLPNSSEIQFDVNVIEHRNKY